jgi:hypothetical protein
VTAIKARKCFFPRSSWVHAFILTCDDRLAVWFKRGHRRYHGRRLGGVPGVCCLYPRSNQALYNLAIVWGSPGKFVWRFLYKKMGYQLVKPPLTPCAGCGTTVGVTSSENPSISGDTVTFTATVTDTDGADTPQGTVTFYDGASLLGSGSALSGSGASATSKYQTSALSVGSHTIKAIYTPTAGSGFQGSQGTVSQTVNSGVSACGCNVPTTVHVTFTGALTGTYALTWQSGTIWQSAPNTILCGGAGSQIGLTCSGGVWSMAIVAGGAGCGVPSTNASSATCSPLSITFNLTGQAGTCCAGAITATVTT